MRKATQIKRLTLASMSAIILTMTLGGAALAVPCFIPTPDCPPSDCG